MPVFGGHGSSWSIAWAGIGLAASVIVIWCGQRKRIYGQAYVKATAGAQSLGQFEYVRSNPVSCRLVLIKRACQGRHKKGRLGNVARSRHSLKNARSQREPWLLAVCPALAHLSAKAVVAAYAQRMQIEETFRDLKSERFGLGFNSSRSTRKDRLSVLLLIACLASFVLRLIGEAGKARKLYLQFQSNT